MAAKKKHKPSAKAKAAYYRNIEKAFERTGKTLAKHNPSALKRIQNKF